MTPRASLVLVCNSHIDPVWLWPWEEGLAEAVAVGAKFAAGPLAEWNWPNARFDCLLEMYQGARGILLTTLVGAFLSGGVDSSAVVATMSLEGAAPVRTFSIASTISVPCTTRPKTA